MKIINSEEFNSLKEKVLYSECEPCEFYGLKIKDEQWEHDYLEIDLIGNLETDNHCDICKAYESAETKEHPLDFESNSRDGMFDNTRHYAVYSKDDIRSFISTLEKLL